MGNTRWFRRVYAKAQYTRQPFTEHAGRVVSLRHREQGRLTGDLTTGPMRPLVGRTSSELITTLLREAK